MSFVCIHPKYPTCVFQTLLCEENKNSGIIIVIIICVIVVVVVVAAPGAAAAAPVDVVLVFEQYRSMDKMNLIIVTSLSGETVDVHNPIHYLSKRHACRYTD